MKYQFQCLPQDVLSHIYGYDDTYKEILKNQVFKELTKKAWIVWFRNHDVKQEKIVNLLAGDYITDNVFDESSIGVKICRFIIPYWFEIFWKSIKESDKSVDCESCYFFNNYHPSDVNVTLIETGGLYHRFFIYFKKNLIIFSGRVFPKEIWGEEYKLYYKKSLIYSDNERILVINNEQCL
jgi:hypothetical protein